MKIKRKKSIKKMDKINNKRKVNNDYIIIVFSHFLSMKMFNRMLQKTQLQLIICLVGD